MAPSLPRFNKESSSFLMSHTCETTTFLQEVGESVGGRLWSSTTDLSSYTFLAPKGSHKKKLFKIAVASG
ncbi:unnamed protein product [Lupinus luteus]|uniref:Uncharacterized protein n=1 Tax=Lupinus luteus TaxID=3873 RepID=A0AAV1X1R9_LUPLU